MQENQVLCGSSDGLIVVKPSPLFNQPFSRHNDPGVVDLLVDAGAGFESAAYYPLEFIDRPESGGSG